MPNRSRRIWTVRQASSVRVGLFGCGLRLRLIRDRCRIDAVVFFSSACVPPDNRGIYKHEKRSPHVECLAHCCADNCPTIRFEIDRCFPTTCHSIAYELNYQHKIILMATLPHPTTRQSGQQNQGDPRDNRLLNSGGQRNAAELDGTCGHAERHRRTDHTVHLSHLLRHAGGECQHAFLVGHSMEWTVI